MNLKAFLVIACMLSFACTSSAQKSGKKKGNFEVGITAGFPTGLLSNFSNFTYGFDMQGLANISKQAKFTISMGYHGFVAKGLYTINGGLIPVLAGIQIYPAEKVFISTQAGVSIGTSGGGAGFTYAVGLGVKPSQNLTLLMKYQSADFGNTNSFVGIRAGISI